MEESIEVFGLGKIEKASGFGGEELGFRGEERGLRV